MIRLQKLFAVTVLTATVMFLASASAAEASDWSWTVLPLDGFFTSQDPHAGSHLVYGARLLNERAKSGAGLHHDPAVEPAVEGGAIDSVVSFHTIRPIGMIFDPAIEILEADAQLAWSARRTSDDAGRSTPSDDYRWGGNFDSSDFLLEDAAPLSSPILSFRIRF